MPIKGLSDQVRLARLDKIRLGIKVAGGKNAYPRPVDHFVCPEAVKKVYGEQPRELRILFPNEDDSKWASQFYRCYSQAKGLICKGDGERATALIDEQTDSLAARNSRKTSFREIDCNPGACARYGKRCRRVMNLQFLLPDVPGLGVWQVDTSGLDAVASVGLSVAVDQGAISVWLDHIRAFKNSYKWSDDELERHIARALKELSYYIPYEMNAEIATTSGSREVSIATLSDRIAVFAVEYPIGSYPPRYQRFSLWQDTLTLLGSVVPDGSDCKMYYDKLHTLDDESCTIPSYLEDLLSLGAQGYALQAYASYGVDRSQPDYRYAQERAAHDAKALLQGFRSQLKRLGRHGRLRPSALYVPQTTPVDKSTVVSP